MTNRPKTDNDRDPDDPTRPRCPYFPDGRHDWAPDPDNPGLGDACTCCGTGR